MFESLEDHIKHDVEQESTRTQRVMRWVVAGVATLAVLGGLSWLIRMVE